MHLSNRSLGVIRCALLILEAILLGISVVALWYHTGPSQPIRASWLWLLATPLSLYYIRWRLAILEWRHTPLLDWLALFVLLLIFNFWNAPLQREGFFIIAGRPLLGIWIVIFMTQVAAYLRDLRPLWVATLCIGFVLVFLALTASDWTEKSTLLQPIIDALPVFDYRQAAQSLEGQICAAPLTLILDAPCFNPAEILRLSFLSFNVNEIAGALAWMIPVLAGLALAQPPDIRHWRILRWSAAIIALFGLLALMLGQSRFAIFGVIGSLFVLVGLLVPARRKRWLAWGAVGLLLVFQLALLANLFTPVSYGADSTAAGLSERDQRTAFNRLALWQSGWRMMIDHPLTGVGMGMYRVAANREPYIIPYYAETNQIPPHTHNEWLQMGADLGVPGFAIYIIWQGFVLMMLWRGWRSDYRPAQITAAAVFAGLLAHAVYGIGDAITLWDRYQFVLWWLVGLASAQWVLVNDHTQEQSTSG